MQLVAVWWQLPSHLEGGPVSGPLGPHGRGGLLIIKGRDTPTAEAHDKEGETLETVDCVPAPKREAPVNEITDAACRIEP